MLKEASGHVVVGVEQYLVQQDLQPLVQVVALLRRLNGGVEELRKPADERKRVVEFNVFFFYNRSQEALPPHLLKVLEGELVHGIDLGEARDDKVQDGAARGHRSVALPGSVDLHLSGFGLL